MAVRRVSNRHLGVVSLDIETHDSQIGEPRATQHAVVGDFGEQHRVIQRVTLRGDVPA